MQTDGRSRTRIIILAAITGFQGMLFGPGATAATTADVEKAYDNCVEYNRQKYEEAYGDSNPAQLIKLAEKQCQPVKERCKDLESKFCKKHLENYLEKFVPK